MANAIWSAQQAIETLLSTELNSLANLAAAISSAQSVNDRYLYADLELYVDYSVAPTAGSLVEVYWVRKLDETNIEDYTSGASGVGSANGYVGGFPVRAVITVQRIVLPKVELPSGPFYLIAINKTGQTLEASGNLIRMRRYTEQSA